MSFYTMECGCGLIDEYEMSCVGPLECSCHQCGAKLTVKHNRAWGMDVPTIQGDTVAGGCFYGGYYDEGMDEYVTSKQHRKELMKQKGLTEYSPDPEMKKVREEIRYVKNTGGTGARKEVRRLALDSTKKRRELAVERAFNESLSNSDIS